MVETLSTHVVLSNIILLTLVFFQFTALRNRIIETLSSYKGLRIVQTRLCVAMASVVIHSIPTQWKNPIMEIVSMFQGNSIILFEVLTVVPEEFSTQVRVSWIKVHVNFVLMTFPTVLAR